MQVPPQQHLLDALNAEWKSFALQAVAHFNFATFIGEEHKSAAELAQTTGTQERWVYRVLRFLAAYGIFAEEEETHTFTNTDLSACLRDDISGSLRAMACMMGSKRVRQEWNALEETMKTGVPAVELLYGKKLYAYLDEHKEEGSLFDAALTSFSAIVDDAITHAYDFSFIKRVVDVGGGRGSLLTSIIAHHPTIEGILFDRPAVIEGIKTTHSGPMTHDEIDSIELVAGDFFIEIPKGADAYILKEVLHNWSDEHSREILMTCRQAMRPDSVLLVCEQVVSPLNNEGSFAKGLDLWMGLEQEGGERTGDEFRLLYESAGFRLTQTLPTHSPHWIFEGVPL